MKPTVLLVEDEDVQRELLAEHLENNGYAVCGIDTVAGGIDAVRKKTIDVVVTDYNLPDNTGLHLLDEIKSVNPEVPVVIITAYGSIEDAVAAMKAGAFDYLSKPINIEQLVLTLKRCLEHRRLVTENRRLKEELGERYSFTGIVASSGKMQEVLNVAGRVAPSKASVLIRGESGTGKEVIARAIHLAGPRKDAPFVAFNVAALSPTLIESELFGHEKGAFTGADRRRDGRFVQAHGGTLFIDEIGDIPIDLQVKFLRVLQENVVEPLGGGQVSVDIRVIAATNKDLEKMMWEGTFREDLFYRLNVVSLCIPPLRDRREDIMPLSDLFLRRYAAENGRDIRGITREAYDSLLKYGYPGNVRELENIVERAVVLARDEYITLDDMPPHLFAVSGARSVESASGGLDTRVEELERRLIEAELVKAGGNQSKAARALDISERKLRYKMQKYGLD